MTVRWGQISAVRIAAAVQGEVVSGPRDVVLKGICTDSRSLRAGEIFWALKGEAFDGRDYIDQAMEKGAAAVVMNREGCVRPPAAKDECAVICVKDTLAALGDLAAWWRRRHGAVVAAITGSAGKTTTKEMTAAILATASKTLKNPGNFNNLIGLPLALLSLDETHRRVVLEMGMNRFGEIGRLTEIADPDVGLITNVAGAHLEGVGDLRGVARAKVEMLEKMSPSARVVLNGDDERLMKAASPFGKATITFGMKEGNDVRAGRIRSLGAEGLSFELLYRGESVPLRLKIPGVQNVYNAAAAAAVALALNESMENVVKGLSSFGGVKGRFMPVRLAKGIVLVDDTYNANPYSLRAAVRSLKEIKTSNGRIIAGLGDMMELGEQALPAHREAGRLMAELGVSHLVALGEHARELIEGALAGGLPASSAEIAADRDEMASRLRDVLAEGDTLFLKGSRRAGLEEVGEKLKAMYERENQDGEV